MEATAIRLKKTHTDMPQHMIEAERYVQQLGQYQTEITTLETELKDRITQIKADYEPRIEALTVKRNRTMEGLYTFAQRHKRPLTEGGKTVVTLAGKFGWRMTPPRVECPKGEGIVIKTLKRLKMLKYLRITVELDKAKLLKDQPLVVGLAYKQHEEFFVAPTPTVEKVKFKTITKQID